MRPRSVLGCSISVFMLSSLLPVGRSATIFLNAAEPMAAAWSCDPSPIPNMAPKLAPNILAELVTRSPVPVTAWAIWVGSIVLFWIRKPSAIRPPIAWVSSLLMTPSSSMTSKMLWSPDLPLSGRVSSAVNLKKSGLFPVLEDSNSLSIVAIRKSLNSFGSPIASLANLV